MKQWMAPEGCNWMEENIIPRKMISNHTILYTTSLATKWTTKLTLAQRLLKASSEEVVSEARKANKSTLYKGMKGHTMEHSQIKTDEWFAKKCIGVALDLQHIEFKGVFTPQMMNMDSENGRMNKLHAQLEG